MAEFQQRLSYASPNRVTWRTLALAFALVATSSTAATTAPMAPQTSNDAAASTSPALQLLIALPEAWPAAQRDALTNALQQTLALAPRDVPTRSTVIGNGAKMTHLGAAVIAAGQAWEPDANAERSLVIVGDGIDVGNTEKSAQTRQELLAEWLPRLRQRGVRVYTVAATEHADDALLAQLAIATDGWFLPFSPKGDIVQRTMDALYAIQPRDTLPIEDGLIKFDDQIQSASLVLYRKDPNLPPRLIPPLGNPFSQFNAPANIKWTSNDVFDLITITKPRVGTWQIEGDQNDANRALADAAMTVQTTPIPRNVLTNDQRVVQVELRQGDKRISDVSVLEHLALKVSLLRDGNTVRLWYPLDNGMSGDAAAEDGFYTVVLNDDLPTGAYDLVVDVEGVSIKRQLQRRFVVHQAPAESRLVFEHGAPLISVVPRMGMLDPQTLVAVAHLRLSDGSEETLPLTRFTATEWRGTPRRDAESVEVNIQATSTSGKPLSAWLGALAMPKIATAVGHAETEASHVTEHDHESSFDDHGEAASTTTHEHAANLPTWLYTVGTLVLANGLLAALLFGGRWWIRRRETRFAQHVWSELTS